MKEMIIKKVIGSTVALVLFFLVLMLTGCKSFSPIFVEGQPDECNDYYSTIRFYVTIESGKDSAFIGTVYNECKIARAEKRKAARETQCKTLYYGASNLDKENYKVYNQYLECVVQK